MTILRLGTRGSPLAIAQAEIIASGLKHAGVSKVEFKVIRTHGDEPTNHGVFTDVSGKALFTQRIEEALVAREIDAAVHSLKDLPAKSLPGIILAAVPPRADPRDALVSTIADSIQTLPRGATVSTSSLRRKSQLRMLRPDLDVRPIRGNVETRVTKTVRERQAGTVLAAAGLIRLGLNIPYHPLDPRDMLPAPGQGALAVQALQGSASVPIVNTLEDAQTRAAVDAERAFAHALGADCNTPVAALAHVADGILRLEGCVLSPDGMRRIRHESTGPPDQAIHVGKQLADEVLRRGADRLLAEKIA